MSEPLSADKPYLIYSLLKPGQEEILDTHECPSDIDYISGIHTRLHPERTIVLGEQVEVTYYRDFDGETFSNPVVRETYSYNRDQVSQLIISRSQTIEWYLVDGTIGPHPKVRGPKFYPSIQEKRDESERRRRNQTSRASEVVIGGLIQMGYTFENAVSAGQTYWKSLVSEVAAFEAGNTAPLRDRISNDTDPSWVSALRTVTLAELQ